MKDDWADQFRRLLADIVGRTVAGSGYPPRAIEAAESRLGVRLPGPLRSYYLAVGRHKINQVHNRLLSPDDLFVSRRHLVFMEDNQSAVYWGIGARSAAADPVVSQTLDPDEGGWAAESPCSKFLPATLCWQAVNGGLPYTGYSDPVDPAVVRRFTRGWPPAGHVGKASAFARGGRALCVLVEDTSALVYLGARGRRDFRSAASELGVPVHET